MNYKKSQYFICFFDKTSQSYLLYNFFTRSLVSVPKKIYAKTKSIINNPDDNSDNKIFETLMEEGFLLPIETNELLSLEDMIKDAELNSPLKLTIAPTLSCNFSCYYCYQNNNNSFLSFQQANVIIKTINSSKRKRVELKWIGGEPLENIDIIRYISNRIKKQYTSTIYTNGYKLNKIIDELEQFHINQIYMTVDGLPQRHNAIRYTATDNNTFNRIIDNIHKVVKSNPSIKIVVKTNIEDFSDFNINKFMDSFKGLEGRIRLNITPVLTNDGEVKNLESFNVFNNEFSKNFDALLSRGFARTKLPDIAIYGCESYLSDSIAISSDGKIHKCIEGIGTQKMLIGEIENNDLTFDSSKYKLNIFKKKSCVKCKLFPVCMGGCFYRQFNSNNDSCYEQNLKKYQRMISNYYNHL